MDDQDRRRKQEDRKQAGHKEIMALSKAKYRSVLIYETPRGFGLFLGVWYFTLETLGKATAFIDAWFDLKRN